MDKFIKHFDNVNLNLNVIKIIYNCLDISTEKLIKNKPLHKITILYNLKHGINTMDIIIKAIRYGHCGFYMHSDIFLNLVQRIIDNINDKRITCYKNGTLYQFGIDDIGDTYINIFELDVFDKIIK